MPYEQHPVLVVFPEFSYGGAVFGPAHIPTYLATATLALIIAIALAIWEAKRQKADTRQVWLFILTCLATCAFFARLFYIIFFSGAGFFEGFLLFFDFRHSGIASSGSFFGLIVGAYVFHRAVKAKIWKLMDIVAIGLMPIMAIGRIGCLFAGCCYGKITEIPWAIYLHGHLRHPTQVYDMISAWCIFIFILWYRKKKHFDGAVFLMTLMLYSFLRFIIEFYRAGETLLGVTYSQYVYAVFFLGCAGTFYWKSRLS